MGEQTDKRLVNRIKTEVCTQTVSAKGARWKNLTKKVSVPSAQDRLLKGLNVLSFAPRTSWRCRFISLKKKMRLGLWLLTCVSGTTGINLMVLGIMDKSILVQSAGILLFLMFAALVIKS